MPNILLPVPHEPQRQNADCLAACAAMVLTFLGQSIDYETLLKLLKIKPYGTSGRNLKHLTALGMDVQYREGSLDEIKNHLRNGIPSIVLVRTEELSYWAYSTDHAVVVVGFDEGILYVNDPAFEEHPRSVPEIEFELAWMLFDYRYGVITPQPQ